LRRCSNKDLQVVYKSHNGLNNTFYLTCNSCNSFHSFSCLSNDTISLTNEGTFSQYEVQDVLLNWINGGLFETYSSIRENSVDIKKI